ncbi:leucine-rich repeat domain-containing protein [Breznakiellaceae bacterium SP9]
MKKMIIVLFVIGLGAAVFAQSAESDFETDGNGTITKYVGWDEAVVIPAQIGGKPVTAIGKEAFEKLDLKSVTIPNEVKIIMDSAFANNKLTSVIIPNSVTYIRWGAFSGNQLTSITLGINVAITPAADTPSGNLFIDYMANSRKAGTYQTDARNRPEKRDGDFGYIETKYGAYLTAYYGSSGNRLMIPEKLNGLTVTAIGDNAFREKGVSRVRIPNSVTSIGDRAFDNNQLTSITIPDSVTYIGYDAFAYNQLMSVVIGKGVTSIEGGGHDDGGTFGSNKLTSVTIPSSVTSIGFAAFTNNKLTSVTIPNSVTDIGVSAFARNQLTSVIIPDSVTSIGSYAFSSNPLTSVTIPANVSLEHDRYSDDSFPNNFASYYNQNGKKAGTYRYDGRNWSVR